MRRPIAHTLFPSGKASRGAFWAFAVAQGLLAAVFIAIGVFVIDPADDDPSMAIMALEAAIGLAYLACAGASVTLGVSRIRDRRGSAWWALLALIPYIGPLWYLREAGVASDNRRPAAPRPPSAA